MHRPSHPVAHGNYRQRPAARIVVPCVLMALCATALTLIAVDALAVPTAGPQSCGDSGMSACTNGNGDRILIDGPAHRRANIAVGNGTGNPCGQAPCP
jgi:hypothetical protein